MTCSTTCVGEVSPDVHMFMCGSCMSCVLVLQYYVSVAAFLGDKRTHSISVATVLDIIF